MGGDPNPRLHPPRAGGQPPGQPQEARNSVRGVENKCNEVTRQSSIKEYFKSGVKGKPGQEPSVQDVPEVTDEQCERAWIGADTVRLLRDVRGECQVVRGWCQDHNVQTVKKSSYKNEELNILWMNQTLKSKCVVC